jgi:hypothetical protein
MSLITPSPDLSGFKNLTGLLNGKPRTQFRRPGQQGSCFEEFKIELLNDYILDRKLLNSRIKLNPNGSQI